jgi:diketogulonate reductase-like aldo/keto reductase
MKYKTVSSITMPQVGIGTYMGKWCDRDTPYDVPSIDKNRDESCKNALREAIKLGAKHIDTSETYGGGHSEKLIGDVLLGLNPNGFKDLFISTKVWTDSLNYDGVISACEKSLNHLGVDDIDLYSIHIPMFELPEIEDYNERVKKEKENFIGTIRALDELVDEGKVRHLGIGNAKLDMIKKVNEISRHGISAVQIQYNLIRRDVNRYDDPKGPFMNMESEILPYCQENGIMFIAHNPLAREFKLMNEGVASVSEACLRLEQMAQKYLVSRAQIAIAWLLSKKNVVTIFQSTNLDHIRDSISAVDLEIDSKDLKLLDEISGRDLK